MGVSSVAAEGRCLIPASLTTEPGPNIAPIHNQASGLNHFATLAGRRLSVSSSVRFSAFSSSAFFIVERPAMPL